MRIAGAEQVIRQLVRHTDRKRFDVSVLCLESTMGPFGTELQKAGFEVTCLGRTPGFDVSLVGKVRKHIVQHGIDIVHCHQYTPYVYGVLGALATGCKVVFTEHGRMHPDRAKLKRVFVNPLLNMATDRITAISLATRRALVEYEKFPAKDIKVIYNGIEDMSGDFSSGSAEDGKKKLGIDQHAAVVGTVARLDRIKNHQMMMRAVQKVISTFPDTVLLLVGDGPERPVLEDLVSELELEPSVIITGFLDHAAWTYRTMDVFLLTSFTEGTSMSLLEAISNGLPCVVTDVGGNPEVVKAGENGILIQSNDVDDLAEKICLLLSDPGLKKRFGENARKIFETGFTIGKMIESYERVYDELSPSPAFQPCSRFITGK